MKFILRYIQIIRPKQIHLHEKYWSHGRVWIPYGKCIFSVSLSRDEDPDPVGSVDFLAAESGYVTFFNGSGSGSYL